MTGFKLIDKYFNDTLSDEEYALFNKLLQEDPAFKEEFLFQKDLKKALQLNQRESLKATLQRFEKDIENKKGLFTSRIWLAAASVIILLGIGTLIFNSYRNEGPAELYAEYFEPYRNIVRPVERGEDDGSIETKAFQAYENGEFIKAINLFNSVESFEEENSDYIDFYKAISFMALDKNKEAVELLLPIATEVERGGFGLTQKANWYLALAYLDSGEIEKARSQFYMISHDDAFTFKKKEAEEILGKLK